MGPGGGAGCRGAGASLSLVMSDFSANWLALREPADHQARSADVLRVVDLATRGSGPVRVVDLAGGTGSNVRFLAERLPPEQSWVVVDHDAGLLAQLPAQMQLWCTGHGFAFDHAAGGYLIRGDRLTCHVSVHRADVASDVEQVIPERAHLVTGSALLDLVSEPWLDRLVGRCEQIGSAALFGLTYDGQVTCAPAEPEDALVRRLVNRHQREDKGFGPALGPDATSKAEHLFRAHGYEVRRARSDWVLAAGLEALQQGLIEGWAEAASDMAAEAATVIRAWKRRRLAHVREGRSSLTVGHQDLVAWLRGAPA